MPKYNAKNKEAKGESKPNYYEGNCDRRQQEMSEGHDTVVNDTAPKTRYQQDQQINPVSSSEKVETPKTGFTKKTTSAGGSALKQEVAAKVAIADSDFAGQPGAANYAAKSAGLQAMSYSGDAGSILGTAANTPVVGTPSRSEGRFEKKLDAPSKKIDFLASEQVVTEYKNPAPLGESPDAVQGYYGTPKNTSIRSQKSAGGTPASLLVERSADELTEDDLVFVEGQYIRPNLGEATWGVEPTKISEFDDTGVRTEAVLSGSDVIRYGNYANRSVTITLKASADGADSAYVAAVKYDSVDLSKDDESQETVNASSTAWTRGMNMDEIARQAIDAKAGRETQLEWSSLGRAVPEPTPTVGLLRRVENDAGAQIFMSYKFSKKGFAYQLNKASKDGQRTTTPMREMILGNIASNISSLDYSEGEHYNGISDIFDKKAMANGAASLLIAIFDSRSKYNTKADILLQPRGLRRAFQVADNNMDVFRVPKEFVAAVNAVDVFSTIDRDYDPLLPVAITDKMGIISSISYDRFGSFTRVAAGAERKYDYKVFTYAYSNRSSNYVVHVKHPILEGVAEFFEQHANKIFSLLKSGDSDTVTISIPIDFATRTLGLWEFLVLYSVPYAQKARINAMRDVLDYEVNFEYPFTSLAIASANPMNAVNYNIKDADSPLETRRMIDSTAIRWIMPEFFWSVGQSKSNSALSRIVHPWYFNEMAFKANPIADKDIATTDSAPGFTTDWMNGIMSMPVIRNGVRLAYLDNLYAMSERDVRLCLDRMTRSPIGPTNDEDYNVYKYGQANEGIPVISGIITIKDYLSTPRELGYIVRAPHGWLRSLDNLVANDKVFGMAARATGDTVMNGDTSFRLRCWKGVPNVPTSILGVESVAISRAQAFRQYWDESPACYMNTPNMASPDADYRQRPEIGFAVSTKQCLTNAAETADVTLRKNQGRFIPFTTGYAKNSSSAQHPSSSTELEVIALHKGFWGRVQRLPMVLSPWDTCDYIDGTGANYDPYDFAYVFGMAGFMASDYNQDLYDRTNMVQNQGWLFTEDPFVKDSPLLADAVKYTM